MTCYDFYKDILTTSHPGQLHTTSNKGFYSFALILLWISEIFTFATDWSTARAGFIDHNTSPFDIANGLQPVIPLLGAFAHLVGIVLSDSILVRVKQYI